MNLPLVTSNGNDIPLHFRFGIGRFTTDEEVDYTADKCIQHVKRLREMRYSTDFNSYYHIFICFSMEKRLILLCVVTGD